MTLQGRRILNRFLSMLTVVVFLASVPSPAFPKGNKGSGGDGGSQAYRITLSNSGFPGMRTDCNERAYILSQLNRGGGIVLKANGPELNIDLLTGILWTRKYDAGKGFSGSFDGCFGVTPYRNGALFLLFGTHKGQSSVEFIWHYEYYDSGYREHFTLQSEKIPFSAWTGGALAGRITGWFDILYYVQDDVKSKGNASYKSITGDQGFYMDLDLTITPDQ